MQFVAHTLARKRTIPTFLIVIVCCTLLVMSFSESADAHPAHVIGALAHLKSSRVILKRHRFANQNVCQAANVTQCYTPDAIRNAYGITALLAKGMTGKGQSIAIIDSFGSPTLQQDLHTFDTDFGLPDPPSLKILAPLGAVSFNVNDQDQVGWAEETDLDVEWAHAIAPAANIVLLTSPVSETEGVQGLPEFLKLEQYVLNHHLATIISQSWAATEETLFTPQGKKLMDSYNAFYQQAAQQHITIFAASGDTGVVNQDVNNKDYHFKTVNFPASSPWVTAVGGTSLFLDDQNNYKAETAWNSAVGSATGGGFSRYFRAPDYQKRYLLPSTQALAQGFRGIPDIALNADPSTGIPVYLGFFATASQNGYYIFGGTSAGAPQWAGLIAIADQLAGHPLGFLNDKLYKIGQGLATAGAAYHDITIGNNTQGSITGYNAIPGWDPVTGWGSPIAPDLVNSLVS
jgi:subtilase family serine protease